MRCANCSTVLPDGTGACSVCGTSNTIVDRATTITAVAPTVSLALGADLDGPRPQLTFRPTARDVQPHHRWMSFAAVAGIVLLLLASSAWGYMTRQQLEAAQVALTSIRADLDAARNDLSSSNAKLSTTSSDLAIARTSLQQEQTARAAAVSQVAQLQKQVALQTGCIQALNANVAELRSISDLMTANYNRTTVGSPWAVANNARDVALRTTINDYYQAYSSAYNGAYSAANNWIATGNGQITVATQQLAILNAEVDKMNSANSQIGAALTTFADHLRSTNTTCGF